MTLSSPISCVQCNCFPLSCTDPGEDTKIEVRKGVKKEVYSKTGCDFFRLNVGDVRAVTTVSVEEKMHIICNDRILKKQQDVSIR